MRHTALAMFVKTPGLSPIKTRLAATIGESRALEFYHLAIKATTAIMLNTQQQYTETLSLFYAIDTPAALHHPLWQDLNVIPSGEGSLGFRLAKVYSTLIQQYDNVILIGADCPQLTADKCMQTLQHLADNHAIVVGPSTDGGFYLFAGSMPIADPLWHNVTYSQQTTSKQLINNLKQANHQITLLPPLTDVDEQQDLEAMVTECSSPLCPEQQAIIDWIRKINAIG